MIWEHFWFFLIWLGPDSIGSSDWRAVEFLVFLLFSRENSLFHYHQLVLASIYWLVYSCAISVRNFWEALFSLVWSSGVLILCHLFQKNNGFPLLIFRFQVFFVKPPVEYHLQTFNFLVCFLVFNETFFCILFDNSFWNSFHFVLCNTFFLIIVSIIY